MSLTPKRKEQVKTVPQKRKGELKMQQKTTNWLVENWTWRVPLSKEFLETLPTEKVLDQLKGTFKIEIEDVENIPLLRHTVETRGNMSFVRLTLEPAEPKPEQPMVVVQVKDKPKKKNDFIRKDVERVKWLGGTIIITKCTPEFQESDGPLWYNYVVKRTNGEVVEDSRARGVDRAVIDERIEYFQSLSQETVDAIKDAVKTQVRGQRFI
jgi:translation elongation factor EF-G